MLMKGLLVMSNIDQELLDQIAELEVEALLEGLKDPDMRKNPSFLEKVRKFLKENNLKTTPETPGVKDIEKSTIEIPVFEIVEGGQR